MDGTAWAIEIDGELAGWLGFTEETEPVPARQGAAALPEPD